MKKSSKLVSLMCGALLALGVASCAPTDDDRIKVTFWHTMGQANEALVEGMLQDFYAKHPGIVVELVNRGGYDELRDAVNQSFPAGTTPTMAFCYPDHVADYMDYSVDLTSYINSTEEFDGETLGFSFDDGHHVEEGVDVSGVDDYVDAYWEEGTQYANQGIYSAAFSKSTEVLFYNVDVFEELELTPPTIWDNPDDPDDPTSFTYVARRLREYVEGEGLEWGGDDGYRALGYDSDDNLYISFSEQLGIPYTSMDETEHYPFGANGGNAEAKNMVQTVKNWYDQGYIITGGVLGEGSYTSTLFAEDEKIFMSIGSSGGTRYNITNSFEVGVAKVPQWNLNNVKTISQGPSICFFNTASEEQLNAAWLVYRHITNSANTASYAISTGYSPVRISSYDVAKYKAHLEGGELKEDGTIVPYTVNSERWLQSKVANITMTMDNDYFVSPVFKGSAVARIQVGSIITDVLTGVKTIDEAFTSAYTICTYA